MNAGACTLPEGLPDDRPPLGSLKTESPENGSQGLPRTCGICGVLLDPKIRSTAFTCGSKCRSIKSRQSRAQQLVSRLELAELRLREAADVLRDYREQVVLQPGLVAP